MRSVGAKTGRRWASACAIIALLVCAFSPHPAVAAEWGNTRILYFERFETTIDPRATLAQKRSTSRSIRFDAYGRRFDLLLERNERLEQLRAAGSQVHLFRGHLNGSPESWARFATNGSDVHGLVWDGSQLYVIEPGQALSDSLVNPLDANDNSTIVFRMTDTMLDAGTSLCATAPTKESRVDPYTVLKRELSHLKNDPVIGGMGAGLRLELSAIGDALFRAQFATDEQAIDQMLLRLNNVDGIFAAELGVQIQVPTAIVYGPGSDPLPSTTYPSELLRRLASLRAATPQLKARGLTHLFTGRDLDGSTVGIGYIGTLCHNEYGAALTEVRGRGAWLESLIAAHEIGHNFGAIHDGEDACAATAPHQFLMSPSVNASNANFSSCSLARMREAMADASCVTLLSPADLAIASDLGRVHEGLGREFEWGVTIQNLGGRTASGRLEIHLPPMLDVIDAWIAGGSCTSGAGTVDCELGTIAGGATRALQLTLNARDIGTDEIIARIVTVSDADVTNNRGTATLSIGPLLDLGVTLDAPAAVDTGERFVVSYSVVNAANERAQDVSIRSLVPPSLHVESADLVNGSCDLATRVCSLESLEPNEKVTGTLTLIANDTGNVDLMVRVAAASFDPNSPNDTAIQSITVSAPTTSASGAATTAPASQGGGGVFGWTLILALLIVGRLARLRCAKDLLACFRSALEFAAVHLTFLGPLSQQKVEQGPERKLYGLQGLLQSPWCRTRCEPGRHQTRLPQDGAQVSS